MNVLNLYRHVQVRDEHDHRATAIGLTRADMPGLGLIGMPPLGQPVLRLQDDRLRYKGQRWRWCLPAPPSMPAMRPA